MSSRDVAIVGMACVFPEAPNLQRYWSNLVNGVDAVQDIPSDRWQGVRNQSLPIDHEAYIPCTRGGFIPSDLWFDTRRFGVLPNAVRHGDADQFLMIHVVDQALRDAGILEDDVRRRTTDLIVGRGGYPTTKQSELMMRSEIFGTVLELIDRRFPELLAGTRRSEVEDYLRSTLSPNEVESVSTAIPNIVASRAANRLNLSGACFNVDAACASSLIALESAMSRLRAGQCDVAVAAGVFMNHTPTFWHVFTRLGALSQTGVIRPFDRRADGLVIGDGAGAIVLKRLADALEAGDEVYAVVKGVGSSGDGRSVDVLAPSSRGQVEALRRAYDDAKIDPSSIGYLELHGTGTVVGDLTEIETVKTFFGCGSAPPTARGMGSVKSMIGHTMPAAGMASLIKTALSLSNKVLPPSLHCEQPRPELADAPFFMNTECRPWVHNGSTGPRRAGVNTFGFGGVNVHAILEEVVPARQRRSRKRPVPRPIVNAVRRPTELLPFCADSLSDLSQQVRSLAQSLQADGAATDLEAISAKLVQRVDGAGRFRLALLCQSVAELKEFLDVCLAEFEKPVPDFAKYTDIEYSSESSSTPGKVAFVFPGMGFPGLIGEYPNHVKELCLHFPEVRAEFDEFEERDRHPEDTVPTSSIFWPPSCLPEAYRQSLRSRLAPPRTDKDEPIESPRPEERYLAAMGVTLCNWVSAVLLRKFEIHPDMITGQSQGEMAAVCAAGAADFRASAPNYWKVLNVDWRDAKGERMAFAWASEELLAPLLEEHPDTHIAIHIGPEATIFGGPPEHLEKIAERLRETQVLVQILPYPPIHTPRLSYLRDKLLTTLRDDGMLLKKPKVPLYSSITSEPYPDDPQRIPETLLKNLDHPLRIWQTIERMYADGARIFVQAGGGQLASSLETLLPGRTDVLATALDLDEVHPITQLQRLLATLFVSGVPLDLRPLFANRQVAELDATMQPVQPPRAATAVRLRIDWNPLQSDHVPSREARSEAGAGTDAAAASDEQQEFREGGNSEPTSATTDGREKSESTEIGDVASGRALSETSFGVDSTRDLQDELRRLRMPFLGELRHFVPERELVMERMLDADEDLFLADHTFVHAPGIKPVAECMPIQPMTFGIELIAEAGALLCPGKGFVGLEDLRASRWIGLKDKPRAPMRIEAKTVSIDSQTGVQRVAVDVTFEGVRSLSGIVLFCATYLNEIDFTLADCSDAGPWPLTAEEVYSQRRMFHGPRLQTICGLHQMGNPSFTGELIVLPKNELFRSIPNPELLTDPSLLDGVGQFLGLWLQLHGWSVLPTGLERMEVYRPTPGIGKRVPIKVELTRFEEDLRRTHCNIEVGDGEGATWFRIVGWSDWIFRWSARHAAWIRNPFNVSLSDELVLPTPATTSVCCLLTKEHLKKSDIERGAHIALSSQEMLELNQIADEGRQWQHLASRIAAKEAFRLWSDRYAEAQPLHPAMLPIGHDASGRPVPHWEGGLSDLRVSLAHTTDVAIALVGTDDVGVDIERSSRVTSSLLPQFATQNETDAVHHLSTTAPDANWSTRLWCAKEAAAKLLGVGLNGAPKNFEAIDIEDRDGFLIHHHSSGNRIRVHVIELEGVIVAYCEKQDVMVGSAHPTTSR